MALKSDQAVIGVYMYDDKVFDFIRMIKPLDCGELEIASVNNIYVGRDEMTYEIQEDEWTDAGTFDSFRYANDLLFEIENKIE